MTDTKHTAAQPLDLDSLERTATTLRDIQAFHPGHFQQLKNLANGSLALIVQARTARLDTTASATGELIAAAEKNAEAYDGDDREGIKTDVINAFYQGAAWQARATLAPVAAQQAAAKAPAAQADVREFVEAVATSFSYIDRETDEHCCGGCNCPEVYASISEPSKEVHTEDCIVLRARDWLAASPASTPEASEQDEQQLATEVFTLYRAVNEMMAHLGARGEISARDEMASAVMDALHGLDGGKVAQRVEDLVEKAFMPRAQATKLAVSEYCTISEANAECLMNEVEQLRQVIEGFASGSAHAQQAAAVAASSLTVENAPIGTLAPSIGGGRWYRTERGWKWNGPDGSGGTFPSPGGDWNGKLIAPAIAGAAVAAPSDKIEEIRALLQEAYGFASMSPRGMGNINAALDLLDEITIAPTAVAATTSEWHDAVLAECMKVESCYHAADPVATVAALIDWHVQHERSISETVKMQADSYVKMTCGSGVTTSDDARDAARLDFVASEECQIEHLDLPAKAPLYRVRWPYREEHQREWSETPREAIDAAMRTTQQEGGK